MSVSLQSIPLQKRLTIICSHLPARTRLAGPAVLRLIVSALLAVPAIAATSAQPIAGSKSSATPAAPSRDVQAKEGAATQQTNQSLAAAPRIRGRLIDAQGKGLAGTLYGLGRQIKTDADGSFDFDDPAANNRVFLRATPVFAYDSARARGRTFLIEPGQKQESYTVTLEPLAGITGRFVDAEDRPFSDVAPKIAVPLGNGRSTVPEQVPWSITVNTDGTFAVRGLPAGLPMQLFVDKPGYQEVRLSLDDVKGGAVVELEDIIVRPLKDLGGKVDLSASVAGRVIDEAGNPVAGNDVYGSFDNVRAEGRTDAKGRFELKGLPVGKSIRVTVYRDGYGHNSFQVPAGKKDAELKIMPQGYAWYGKPAPSLLVEKWINHGPLTLADLKGKVVLLGLAVNFENPSEMQRVAKWQDQYLKRGLVVIAVCQRLRHGEVATASAIEPVLKANNITFPVALDAVASEAEGLVPPGRRLISNGATYSVYDVKATPAIYLVDKKGILRCSPTPDNMDEWIGKLLAE